MWDRISIVLYLACVRINVSEMAQHIKSTIFSYQGMSSEQSDFILEVFTFISGSICMCVCFTPQHFDAELISFVVINRYELKE